jgi:hypothetical protein
MLRVDQESDFAQWSILEVEAEEAARPAEVSPPIILQCVKSISQAGLSYQFFQWHRRVETLLDLCQRGEGDCGASYATFRKRRSGVPAFWTELVSDVDVAPS